MRICHLTDCIDSLIAARHPLVQQSGKLDEDYTKLISFVTDRPRHDRRYALDSGRVAGLLEQDMMLGGPTKEFSRRISALVCRF